jgi:hypothetical protein
MASVVGVLSTIAVWMVVMVSHSKQWVDGRLSFFNHAIYVSRNSRLFIFLYISHFCEKLSD